MRRSSRPSSRRASSTGSSTCSRIDGRRRRSAAADGAAGLRGIKGLQERVKTAAKSYLSHGNAAVDKDWAEFWIR